MTMIPTTLANELWLRYGARLRYLTLQTEEVQTPGGAGSMEPDPDWSYVDKCGHEHHWHEDGVQVHGATFVKKEWWCESCMTHHAYEGLVCSECGEDLYAGYRYSGRDRWVIHQPTGLCDVGDMEFWENEGAGTLDKDGMTFTTNEGDTFPVREWMSYPMDVRGARITVVSNPIRQGEP